MTPDELRQITDPATVVDPATRERAAREAIEYYRQRMAQCAAIREQAVRDLYKQHRNWRKVGEIIGASGQHAHRLATR
jgi:hypothetical protein